MRLSDLFDLFMFDLDGAVYMGDVPTPGAAEVLETLREKGKTVVFITNNPTKAAIDFSEKLNKMGIRSSLAEIVNSSKALSNYLKNEFRSLATKKAYVIGTESLKEEIAGTGLQLVDGEEAETVDFVIAGVHPEFNYSEIKLASTAIRNGARFFGTNPDPFVPHQDGFVPGTGSILAAIETASQSKATVAGKPEPIMFASAMEKVPHISKEKTVIIGDRLNTDIKGGRDFGIETILTLSGSTTEDEITESEIKPGYIIRDLRDLLKDLPRDG